MMGKQFSEGALTQEQAEAVLTIVLRTHCVPMMRNETAKEHPGVIEALMAGRACWINSSSYHNQGAETMEYFVNANLIEDASEYIAHDVWSVTQRNSILEAIRPLNDAGDKLLETFRSYAAGFPIEHLQAAE
jgi:hypothetical protein